MAKKSPFSSQDKGAFLSKFPEQARFIELVLENFNRLFDVIINYLNLHLNPFFLCNIIHLNLFKP